MPVCHTVPYRLIPSHTVPCRPIPSHTVPYRLIPSYTVPYRLIPSHTVHYRPIPPHFQSCWNTNRSQDSATSTFIVSRLSLDYCNLIIAGSGTPACELEPLEHVQHAAVRLVGGLGPRDHVTEHIKDMASDCIPQSSNYAHLRTEPPSVSVSLAFGTFSDLPGRSRLRSALLLQQDSIRCFTFRSSNILGGCPLPTLSLYENPFFVFRKPLT